MIEVDGDSPAVVFAVIGLLGIGLVLVVTLTPPFSLSAYDCRRLCLPRPVASLYGARCVCDVGADGGSP